MVANAALSMRVAPFGATTYATSVYLPSAWPANVTLSTWNVVLDDVSKLDELLLVYRVSTDESLANGEQLVPLGHANSITLGAGCDADEKATSPNTCWSYTGLSVTVHCALMASRSPPLVLDACSWTRYGHASPLPPCSTLLVDTLVAATDASTFQQ